MHVLGCELILYDPKIKCTLWKARKGKEIVEKQMEGGIDKVNLKMGEAIG